MKCDMIGKKYGHLTVLSELPPQNGRAMVLCRCDCGREKRVNRDNLRRGLVKTCGECRISSRAGQIVGPGIDITGQKFGRLTAVKFLRHDRWLFQCDCGKTVEARPSLVKSGEIQSCGCLLKETAKKKATEQNVFEHYDGTTITMLKAAMAGTNRRKPGDSGAVGVRKRKLASGRTRYQAHIMLRGKNITLGTYDTLEEAVAARKAGEAKYYQPLIDEFSEKNE